MNSIYILFALAALMLIAAVYLYSTSENNSYDKLNLSIQDAKVAADRAEKSCATFQKTLEAINTRLNDTQISIVTAEQGIQNALGPVKTELSEVKKEFSIINVRQSTLEKKIYQKDRNINLRLNNGLDGKPIEVELYQKPPPVSPPPLPKGKGQEALLKKAGVRNAAP